jgi:hypothetical protein
MKSRVMIGNRFAIDDFFHLSFAVAGLMGKKALGFPDLLDHTGRQYGFVGHFKEAVLDGRGTGVDHQNLHHFSLWFQVSGVRCQANINCLIGLIGLICSIGLI